MTESVLCGMIKNKMATMATTSSCKNYEEFICGFGAAVINIAVTFPINKIIFRQVRLNYISFFNLFFWFKIGNCLYLLRSCNPKIRGKDKRMKNSLQFQAKTLSL